MTVVTTITRVGGVGITRLGPVSSRSPLYSTAEGLGTRNQYADISVKKNFPVRDLWCLWPIHGGVHSIRRNAGVVLEAGDELRLV